MLDFEKMKALQTEIASFKSFQPDTTGNVEVRSKTIYVQTDLSDETFGKLFYALEYKNLKSEDPMTYFRAEGSIEFQGLDQALTAVRWLKQLPFPSPIP
jgi:hypothetical protein